jgi:hypothetical protein
MPTTVRNYLRQSPLVAAFNWIAICFIAFGLFAADNGLSWSPLFAALAGIPVGTTAWWLLTFGSARGWIHNE